MRWTGYAKRIKCWLENVEEIDHSMIYAQMGGCYEDESLKTVLGDGLDSSGSGQEPVASSCKRGDEPEDTVSFSRSTRAAVWLSLAQGQTPMF